MVNNETADASVEFAANRRQPLAVFGLRVLHSAYSRQRNTSMRHSTEHSIVFLVVPRGQVLEHGVEADLIATALAGQVLNQLFSMPIEVAQLNEHLRQMAGQDDRLWIMPRRPKQPNGTKRVRRTQRALERKELKPIFRCRFLVFHEVSEFEQSVQ